MRPLKSPRGGLTRRELIGALVFGSLGICDPCHADSQATKHAPTPDRQGGPEGPRVRPDIAVKSSGQVTVATPATLQALIDSARAGDRITCDPSTAWVGNWRINRAAGQVPITIASSRDDKPSASSQRSRNPCSWPSARWEACTDNTETTLDAKVNFAGGQSIIQFGENEQYGQHPRGFGFRRSRIFGNPTQDVRRGILANCGDFFFVDGRIEEIHQRGSDSQAICGWNSGKGI